MGLLNGDMCTLSHQRHPVGVQVLWSQKKRYSTLPVGQKQSLSYQLQLEQQDRLRQCLIYVKLQREMCLAE